MSTVKTQDIEWLRHKTTENPESMLFARLAEKYLQMQETDRAIEIAEKGIDKHPHYATGYFVLAKCFLEKKQFDLAGKNLKIAAGNDPRFLSAHKVYGELMKQVGNQKAVEASYNQILEYDPFDKDIKTLAESLQSDEEPAPVPEETIEFEHVPDAAQETTELESDTDKEEMPSFDEDNFPDFNDSSEEEPFFESDEIFGESEKQIDSDPDASDIKDKELPDFASFEDEKDKQESEATEQVSEFDEFLDSDDSDAFDFDTDESKVDGPSFEESEFDATSYEEKPDDEQSSQGGEFDDFLEPQADDVSEPGIDDETESDSGEQDKERPEYDFDENQYKQEETQFSELLDNIFSPSLKEEEDRETETRNKAEKVGQQPYLGDFEDEAEKPGEAQPSVQNSDEGWLDEDAKSPEETIMQEGGFAETLDDASDDMGKDLMDDEQSLPEEFLAMDDQDFDKDTEQTSQATVPPKESKDENIEDLERQEEELSEFLASLDIKESEADIAADSSADEDDEQDEVFGPDLVDGPGESQDDIEHINLDHAARPVESEEPEQFDKPILPEDDDQDELEYTPASEPTGEQKEVAEEKPAEQEHSSQNDEGESDQDVEQEQQASPQQTTDSDSKQADQDKTREKFVTPTLGEIYAAQGQYAKAIDVFETLIRKYPDNEWYQTKLANLKKRVEEQES